jgi:diguanylate cyclase (GGDEF)-like protein
VSTPPTAAELLHFVASRIEVGVLAVDLDMRVLVWNRFLEAHSGRSAAEIVGRSLFDAFPELPREWLERKVRSVAVLKNFAFTSWRQRPFLFNFRLHRPVTGGVDLMRQDCTFLPVVGADGAVSAVCITILDATETCMYQTQLQEALASIAEQSVRDALTGLYNRRKLDEQLGTELARAVRHGRPLSLLMLDIDHFKRVNDQFGHIAGDGVIRHVAHLAASGLRMSDFIGRYGGEEFVAILPEATVDGAVVVAERIRSTVEGSAATVGDLRIPVTVSVGVTQLGTASPTAAGLLGEADEALYQSKNGGRNRVSVHHRARAGAEAV